MPHKVLHSHHEVRQPFRRIDIKVPLRLHRTMINFTLILLDVMRTMSVVPSKVRTLVRKLGLISNWVLHL